MSTDHPAVATERSVADQARRLVLVSGAGRSGTSSAAGALNLLGLHVPLPVLPSNESNPRGFFESVWPVRFHRHLMDTAFVEQTDGSPDAVARMRRVVTPEVRDELRAWLSDVSVGEPQILVKDPRSVYVPWLWAETAQQLGMATGYLTMIRHPAEVLGSRSTYYTGTRTNMGDWRFSVMNLCGWINGNLAVEHQTRGQQRVVLRYDDLIGDWRRAMATVAEDLGITFDYELDAPEATRVDEFIDPTLRRHEVSWAEFEMPSELVEIAEDVWGAMCRVADGRGTDKEAESKLDQVRERYATLYQTSQAIARDAALSQVKKTRKETATRVRAQMRAQVLASRRDAAAANQLAARRGLVGRASRAARRRVAQHWSRRKG